MCSNQRATKSSEPFYEQTLPGSTIYYMKHTLLSRIGLEPRHRRRRGVSKSAYALFALNVAVIATTVSLAAHHNERSVFSDASVRVSPGQILTKPIDQMGAAGIASNVALVSGLPEAALIANQVDSFKAELSIVPAQAAIVAKPQIVNTALKSKKDIKKYKTVAGDTVTSIAAKYGVTSDSVRWSNNITGEAVIIDKELYIPPQNGIVYSIKSGDTSDSLSVYYKANREQLVAFNDAELNPFKKDDVIFIPNGLKPSPVAVNAIYSSSSSASYGFTAVYGGNGYDPGNCTWYAANRRAASGRPVPRNLGHARTWAVNARAAGLSVGRTPSAGAVAVTTRGYYGHVMYVESVNSDGSIVISDMNVRGLYSVRSSITLPAAEAGSYEYVY
jgi:N-acetylmuramoyl-L-alanine amidase